MYLVTHSLWLGLTRLSVTPAVTSDCGGNEDLFTDYGGPVRSALLAAVTSHNVEHILILSIWSYASLIMGPLERMCVCGPWTYFLSYLDSAIFISLEFS